MRLAFTVTQKQRLIELDAGAAITELVFNSEEERDSFFRNINRELVHKNRERLDILRLERLRPAVREMEQLLVKTLNEAGFVETTSPTTMSGGMLAKMGITGEHPLYQQVYWLDKNTCLRPMLAPNLYAMLGRLEKLWPDPIRIFEVGQCFRKESKGSRHLSEFTMLNLVEMGLEGDPGQRLKELAGLVMNKTGLVYSLEAENSEVYGDTVDVIANGMELASGATGPHPLDAAWNITKPWAGLGFGIERLVMVGEGFQNIRRVGRSLMYLDGARLNI